MSDTRQTVTVEQFIAREPAAVWEAITSPEWIARWWGPGDVRAEVGHRFELDMGRWGLQPCKVLEVEPLRRFCYTFGDWRLLWTLSPVEGGTLLRLDHQGFDLTNPRDRMACEGMDKGWRGTVLPRLGALLEQGVPVQAS